MDDLLLDEGMKAPAFTLKDADENYVTLKDFRGKNVVLYFYPKDNTPGCTTEALDFTDLKSEFEKNDTAIMGISRDSCISHQNFIDKKNLTIKLLSDPDSSVQKKYGVWRPKKFMGREFLGTVRSTFLIGKDGRIKKYWDKVKAKGHAKEVLEEVKKI